MISPFYHTVSYVYTEILRQFYVEFHGVLWRTLCVCGWVGVWGVCFPRIRGCYHCLCCVIYLLLLWLREIRQPHSDVRNRLPDMVADTCSHKYKSPHWCWCWCCRLQVNALSFNVHGFRSRAVWPVLFFFILMVLALSLAGVGVQSLFILCLKQAV